MNLIRSCPKFQRKQAHLNARTCDLDRNKRANAARKSVTLRTHHLHSPRTAPLSSVRAWRTQLGETGKSLINPALAGPLFLTASEIGLFPKKRHQPLPDLMGGISERAQAEGSARPLPR
jgi:hypothetical protein